MDRPSSPAESERIFCFDTETGRLVWEHVYSATYGKLDYPKGPRCTPTVHDGRVFTLGAVGQVVCLDAATGSKQWTRDLVREYESKVPEWGFAASPVIHGGNVIVHAGVERGAYLAFNQKDGSEIWRGGEDPTGYGTPIVIDRPAGEQLVGWTPEHVLGLSVADGRELWRFPYKVTYGVSIATPIFQENTVLVCGYWEGSKAIRLGERPDSAELLWEENRFLRGLMSQPLYRNGLVFLLDKQHGVVCFRLATGEKIWTDENRLTRRDRNPQVNMVWIGDTDRVLCTNAEGELVQARFTENGYEELARCQLTGETWAHPAYAGTRVYARDDATLVCAELPVEN